MFRLFESGQGALPSTHAFQIGCGDFHGRQESRFRPPCHSRVTNFPRFGSYHWSSLDQEIDRPLFMISPRRAAERGGPRYARRDGNACGDLAKGLQSHQAAQFLVIGPQAPEAHMVSKLIFGLVWSWRARHQNPRVSVPGSRIIYIDPPDSLGLDTPLLGVYRGRKASDFQ